MKGKSGIKDCPRCGLRNRLSAVTCDFCGYQFPRIEEDVDEYIDTLDRLSKETAYRMSDDVSEKIRSTLKSPTDVPTAKRTMTDPVSDIPDSIVATTLVSIPKVAESPETLDEPVKVHESHDPDPLEADVVEAAPIESITDDDELDADDHEDVMIVPTPPAEVTMSTPMEEEIVTEDLSVTEDDEAGTIVEEDAIATLALAAMDEDGDSIVLSAPEVEIPSEAVVEETSIAVETPFEDAELVPIEGPTAPEEHVEDAPEAGPSPTSDEKRDEPVIVEEALPKAVVAGVSKGHGGKWLGLALLASGAIIYAGLIGMHSLSDASIAYAWGGGVLGAALISFGAYLMATRLLEREGTIPAPSMGPVSSGPREVVLCPRCYEVVSDEDRSCPVCGAEFKEDR